MRVFISAGEASGDALGAALVRELKARDPSLVAYGMGGSRMAAEGFEVVKSSDELNVMGLVEVLRHLPRLFKLLDQLTLAALAGQPDVAVLIDVPDFNIRLARRLTKRGVPVAGYVGPSVWAWRAGRVKRFKRWMTRMLVLFPFELDVWRSAGMDVECVGHPLLDEVAATSIESANPRVVALLPGSRDGEIRRHLDVMLETAKRLADDGLVDRFVLPVAPTLDMNVMKAHVERHGLSDRVALIEADGRRRRAAIAESLVALVASGTATLETALVGRPQVIFYRVNWLSFAIGRLLMTVKHFGLPNIIAGRQIAPELLQGEMSVDRLYAETKRLLEDDAARADAMRGIDEVRARLGAAGAAERAADAVLALAQRSLPPPR